MNEGKDFGIYAVKDNLVGKFLQPIFFENDDVAKRWFKYIINNNEQWKDSASDFTIHKIGVFNDSTGINDYSVDEQIGNGAAFVERT